MMWRQIVEAPRRRGLARCEPLLASLSALPCARGETEDFDLDAAALERAGEDVGAAGRNHDRPSAHRTRVVEQQRHHGVAEICVALTLEGEREHRIDDNARQTRDVQRAFLDVEVPGPVLLRK